MPKAKRVPIQNPLSALVDELGLLEKRAAVVKPVIARIDAIRKILRGSAADLNPAESKVIFGLKFSAFIGPCGNKSSVNVTKLSSLVTDRAFLGMASVTLEAIEDLAPEVAAQVVETTQTGTRALNVVEVKAAQS